MGDTFRPGFVGSLVQQATEWITEEAGNADSILIPFAGAGRSACVMARYGRTIESWDTQIYSRALIEGVLSAKKVETNVDKIHYRKGWMYETRAMPKIDERCAGFIDWVSKYGTLFDKACLGSAIIRSTLMGRMGQWNVNMEKFWRKFCWNRDYMARWIDQPGTFCHHLGSFFDGTLQDEYDYCMVDPPKIVAGGTDVYSSRFQVLNSALLGPSPGDVWPALPAWKPKDVETAFHYIMRNVNAKKFAILYVSDVSPSLEELKKLLSEYGTVTDGLAFEHGNRFDYGFTVVKHA